MVGPYATLLVFVLLSTIVAWRYGRRAGAGPLATGSPASAELFPFAASISILAVAIGILIAWAPSVSAVSCSPAMLAAGRCRESSLMGASGLMLFLVPLGVAVAYLWSEGLLSRAPAEVAAPSAPVREPVAVTTEPDDRILRAQVERVDVPLSQAIDAAASRLRGKQVAVVFSGAASERANEALAQFAAALAAPRFVVAPDGPAARAAHSAAGPAASHADELALALAGGLYQGVVLLEAEAQFHELTRMSLGMVGSVCLAERETETSKVCAVVLPAASEEEAHASRDGAELDGDRRPRDYLLTLLRRTLAPDWRPDPATPPESPDDEDA